MPNKDNGKYVTIRELYEELEKHPTRRELWLVVGCGLVLGQISAALIGGVRPAQAAELALRVLVG